MNPETISKCFRKAGVLQDATMDVVARAHDTEDDPFLESDACMELQNLLEKTMPSEQRCSLAEYLSGEEGVAVCVDMDGDEWDANFIVQLVDGDEGVDGDEAGDDDMDVDEEPVCKYDKFSHVIKELDEIKLFLEDRGYSREADAVSSVVDMVASAHITSTKQTTLQDYLVPQPSAENP